MRRVCQVGGWAESCRPSVAVGIGGGGWVGGWVGGWEEEDVLPSKGMQLRLVLRRRARRRVGFFVFVLGVGGREGSVVVCVLVLR